MSNQLQKDVRVTYIPAVIGQAFRSAYDYSTVEHVCHLVPPAPPPGTTTSYSHDAQGNLIPVYHYPNGSIGFGGPITQVCQDEVVIHHVAPQPYVAAVPAQTIYDYNLGWNAGARSVQILGGDGFVSAQFPGGAVGAFMGMSNHLTYSYVDLSHAWYVSHGHARVYENGVMVHDYGLLDGGDRLRIDRLAGVVRYYVGDTVEYTSAVPNNAVVFMNVVLYAGYDFVYNPEIGSGIGWSAGHFIPLTGAAHNTGATVNQAITTFEPLTGYSTFFSGSAASFEAMTGHGTNHFFDDIEGMAFQPMTGFGQGPGFLLPSFAISSPSFSPLEVYRGHGLTGTIGNTGPEWDTDGPVSFRPLIGLGWDHAGGGTFDVDPAGLYGSTLLPLIGYGSAFEGNDHAYMVTQIGLFDSQVPATELIVVMNSEIGIVSTMLVSRQFLASLISTITMTPSMSTSAILTALMSSTITVDSTFPTTGETSIWVVNADTKASTQYEDFDFNSYAKIGDTYYGMAPGGLYALEGDDDDGVPVNAMISLGKRNFGTTFLKRMANAYVGISTSGTMYLKVFVEGREWVYKIRNNDPNLQAQRFDLGKGLRATYFELELHNAGGADFELDTVEFVAAVLQRRI